MSYLVRTTLYEIAAMADEMDIDDTIIFSTEDPDELEHYKLQPCKWNVIKKSKLLYESDYVVIIGLIDGHCTIAKDIYILTDGNINDEDSRIDGIKEFLDEYYEQYMIKNKDNHVYLINC